MKDKGNLIWGIILIVIGVIIGLNSLGITNINFPISSNFNISCAHNSKTIPTPNHI